MFLRSYAVPTLALLAGLVAACDAEGDTGDLRAELDALAARTDALEIEAAALAQQVSELTAQLAEVEAAVPDPITFVLRTEVGTPISAGEWYTHIVECAEGEVAVGGGAGFDGNRGDEILQQSYPVGPTVLRETLASATGWLSIIRNDSTAFELTPTGYVICARM